VVLTCYRGQSPPRPRSPGPARSWFRRGEGWCALDDRGASLNL